MPTYRLTTAIPTATPQQLFDWHGRPGAFHRLNPPFDPVRVVERSGPGLEVGTTLQLETKVGPVPVRWTARHTACDAPHGFTDVQENGPFSTWEHQHRFLEPAEGDAGAVLEDEIRWEAPLGALGAAVGGVHGRLERAFGFRHQRTANDQARLHPWRDAPRMKVAISGATGLVGTALTAFLDAGGHQVVPMVRKRDLDGIFYDARAGEIDAEALRDVDAVVLLAGAPIAANRWTDAEKEKILRSRVDGVSLVSEALAGLGEHTPKVLISGSAVGVYGDGGEQVLSEDAGPGEGFLAEVGEAWEAAARPAVDAGIRTVWLRTGIVLSATGGYLEQMLPLFKAGAGGPQGPGSQYLPWIHLDDLIGLIHDALHDERWEGPVNGSAPEPVPQRAFAKVLGRVLGRPAFVPTPATALKLALGAQKAEELVLTSQRMVPSRALSWGYAFTHPDLEGALRFELGR